MWTELVEHREGFALFRAGVWLAHDGVANGWAARGGRFQGDYAEKALRLVLSALCFGTQCCEDYSYGADAGRVVDTPIARREGESAQGRGGRATESQVKAM